MRRRDCASSSSDTKKHWKDPQFVGKGNPPCPEKKEREGKAVRGKKVVNRRSFCGKESRDGVNPF